MRYFFHNEDGKCFPDENGVELPSIAAARHTAMRVLSEMVLSHEQEFWDCGAWRLTVTDADGLILWLIDLGVTNGAVAPGDASGAARPDEPLGG